MAEAVQNLSPELALGLAQAGLSPIHHAGTPEPKAPIDKVKAFGLGLLRASLAVQISLFGGLGVGAFAGFKIGKRFKHPWIGAFLGGFLGGAVGAWVAIMVSFSPTLQMKLNSLGVGDVA